MMDPPDGCVCPITGQIFIHPVLLPDGHTFERSAIEEWLKSHSHSPVTNQQVGGCSLVPNWAIKKVVDDWLLASPSQLTDCRQQNATPGDIDIEELLLDSPAGSLGASHPRPHPLCGILDLLETTDSQQQGTAFIALDMLLQDQPDILSDGMKTLDSQCLVSAATWLQTLIAQQGGLQILYPLLSSQPPLQLHAVSALGSLVFNHYSNQVALMQQGSLGTLVGCPLDVGMMYSSPEMAYGFCMCLINRRHGNKTLIC
ncbi:hypothetical protein WJX74_005721 [Apatococcus lobatus]|uniref:RING-type E3 ubiquitin transferase n=1 Tax=Apatococcus lobatus TaxID=904363 RepID=A0AAW1QUU0_9CHLO